MSNLVMTFEGDEKSISAFIDERFIRPAAAMASAERAEMIMADQVNDLRREHAQEIAEIEFEKDELTNRLNDALNDVADLNIKLMQQSYNSKSVMKNGFSSDDMRNKIFALFESIAERQRAATIRIARELTGCKMIEINNKLKPIFDLMPHVRADAIPMCEDIAANTNVKQSDIDT